MFEMTLPDPGEGLIEAEIVRWLVAEGDVVQVNDPLLEIETAKSVVELPSAVAGVVHRLLVPEGSTAQVGSVIATIRTVGDVDDEPHVPAKREEASGSMLVGYGSRATGVSRRPRKGVVAKQQAVPETEQVHESYGLDDSPGFRTEEVREAHAVKDEAHEPPLPGPEQGNESQERPLDPAGRPLAKPQTRRLARDLGIDLRSVVGTGEGGIITPLDVAQAAAGASGTRHPITRIPLRGVRKQMVQAMQASVEVPQASVWMDVDVTKTVELIEQLKRRREFDGLRVSPIVVLAKAVCLAIERHPEVNSSLDLVREEILVKPDVNLGIAAATRRGLLVPNIKRANTMNLLELAQALNEMVAMVREGRMKPQDASDGTFTITNVGVFGVEGGTPILNPGESAILLLGTFNRRPWVMGERDDERLEIRSVAKLTLTIDHRVLDGEQASRFLADVAAILEDPGLSLLF